MTTPAPPPPAAQQKLDQFVTHAAELYALEKLASKMVVGPLRKRVQGVWRAAALLWVRMFGALDNPATPEHLGEFLAAVRKDIASIDPKVAGPLTEYADKALRLGVKHALDEVGSPRLTLTPTLTESTSSLIAGLDQDLRRQLLHTEQAIQHVTGDRYKDTTDALTATQRAVTSADRAVTVTVNEASNSGSDQVAEKLGAERLWVAERDACVHCLAYAGEVAPVGGSFPVGLTFGKKPLVPWPDPNVLPGCPLHPNCRCRTTPWLGHVDGAPGPSLPEVLKREAQRSILTGWRTETESEGARLDAATRLLRRGTTLPKSVQQRARQAVKRGRFTTFPRASK